MQRAMTASFGRSSDGLSRRAPRRLFLDQTYGHLLPDSEDYLRGLLDAYDGVHGLNADSAGR